MFVFGDSFADTGNSEKGISGAWKEPSGITFPGKPAGRASNGRILTDYIATYLGVKSPVPYTQRKLKPQDVKDGMNFAYGGTGVLVSHGSAAPNMTTQIDFMEQLIKQNVYSATDLTHSVALVSAAGNDYLYGGAQALLKGIPSYIPSVVNQITTNLKRINGLGVKKIAVTGVGPIGCIPLITAPLLFQHCNDIANALLTRHDTLLNKAVAKLNQEANDGSRFVVLDIYDSVISILNNPSAYNFNQNPLRPCCLGVSFEYLCGNVDENNVNKYTVCDDPNSAFFWDAAHPTQARWNAIYNIFISTNALYHLQF